MSNAVPKREFRAPDSLWKRVRQRAIEEDVTVSLLIVRALKAYLSGTSEEPPNAAD